MKDELLFKKIAQEVEQDWQMGGLSDGLYYDFAKEVANRYIERFLAVIRNNKEDAMLKY